MSTVQPMGEGTAPPVIGPQPGPYPQAYPGAQPVQVIYIQTTGPTRPRVYDNYSRRTSMFLGVARIGIGILSIIFQISAIVVEARKSWYGPLTTSVSGAGIWCGLFFILAGSFGVAAASGRTMCLIVTNMVLAIVSVAIFGTTYLGLSAGGLAIARHRPYHYGDYYYDSYHEIHKRPERVESSLIGLFSVMLILAFAECVCDIWSSAICCKAVCCGYSSATPQAQQLQYVQNQPGQQIMYMNNPNMVPQPATVPSMAAPSTFPYPVQGGTREAGYGGDSPPPAYGADTSEQKHALPS